MNLYDWDFSAPTPSTMGDHDVPMVSQRLQRRRIALQVTGGIAAMKAPQLARGLRRYGAEVVAFAADDALRYVGLQIPGERERSGAGSRGIVAPGPGRAGGGHAR